MKDNVNTDASASKSKSASKSLSQYGGRLSKTKHSSSKASYYGKDAKNHSVVRTHQQNRKNIGGVKGPIHHHHNSKEMMMNGMMDEKKHRRKKHGLATRRLIRALQTGTKPIIKSLPFARATRELCNDITTRFGVDPKRFQPKAITTLQAAIEAEMVKHLNQSLLCALHAGRQTVLQKDLNIVKNHTMPYLGQEDV
jgi:histone H3